MISLGLLLVLFASTAGEVKWNSLSYGGKDPKVFQDVTPTKQAIVVTLCLLERTPTRLKFQMKVLNTGDKSVFIVTDPVRVDGSRGVYVWLNENDPTQFGRTIDFLVPLRFLDFNLLSHPVVEELRETVKAQRTNETFKSRN
jgi:hypothetical protein